MTRRIQNKRSTPKSGAPIEIPFADGANPTEAARQPLGLHFARVPAAIFFDRDPRITGSVIRVMGMLCSFARTSPQPGGKVLVYIDVKQTTIARRYGVRPQSISEPTRVLMEAGYLSVLRTKRRPGGGRGHYVYAVRYPDLMPMPENEPSPSSEQSALVERYLDSPTSENAFYEHDSAN